MWSASCQTDVRHPLQTQRILSGEAEKFSSFFLRIPGPGPKPSVSGQFAIRRLTTLGGRSRQSPETRIDACREPEGRTQF